MTPSAGLILAAGMGIRFGGHKLVADLYGRPILQHVLDLAAQAGLAPVVVVLGNDGALLEQACSWRDEVRVVNPNPGAGISGSVRLGLAALEASDAVRAVVLLGDQPSLSLEQVTVVLAAAGSAPIVVPHYGGRPGNPVILDRSVWPLAASLAGDRGMSQLFAAHPELVAHVDAPGGNPDIDTREDLARL